MSYNSLKTTAAAAAVISVGALAFSGHAEAYWRHHYHHRHVAFVPVASMSAPASEVTCARTPHTSLSSDGP